MQKIALIGISLAIIISLGAIAYTVSITAPLRDNLEITNTQIDLLNDQLDTIDTKISEINKKIGEQNVFPVLDMVKDSWNRTIILVPRNVESPPSLPEGVVLVRIPTQRIVSFAPGVTATLFNIGMGDNVVALTQFDDWPQEVLDKKESGEVEILENLIEPEVERILSLDPDLLITIPFEHVDSLTNVGIPVVVVDLDRVSQITDIIKSIELIGKVSGAEESASELGQEIEQSFLEVQEKVLEIEPKPSVFWLVWHQPIMTSGQPSFLSKLIETAGGVNMFNDLDTPWPVVNSEEVIARNPDFIFINESMKYSGIASVEDLLTLFPAWTNLETVKNEGIKFVPDYYIQPGPRTGQAVEELAAILHPDLFSVRE
jgi:iron complex transport system substrate-binding protein